MNARFDAVRKRILSLERCYLSSDVNPLGEYSQEQQDNARAYVLLSHAEIESFLEEMSLQAGEAAVSFIKSGKYNDLTMRYLYHAGCDAVVSKQKHESIYGIVKAFFVFQRNEVAKNHGIKERNFRALFHYFLFDKEIDSLSILIPSLDSLGSRRGDYAHNSFLGISKIINPDDCKIEVESALSSLQEFSEDFDNFISAGFWNGGDASDGCI